MKFCGSDKKYTDTPQWFDPLGPDASGSTSGSTGGPEAREALFNSFQGYMPEWLKTGDAASAASTAAANDPAWKQLQNNAGKVASGLFLNGTQGFNDIFSNYRNAAGQQSGVTQDTLAGNYLKQNPTGTDARSWQGNDVTNKTLSGAYLNSSPQATANVDPMLAGVRRRGQAEAADNNAAIQSSFNRAGMGFSTANQQAQQANNAAASARSGETEAAARLAAQQAADQQKFAGYQAERGIQSQAANAENAANRQRLGLQAANYGNERGYQQQAGLATDAAKQQAAALEASSRANNYGQERTYQQNAAQQLSQAQSAPINYLNTANQGNINTLQQVAQIVQGLAGNGQIATPQSTVVKQPGVYDYALGTLGAVSSV